MDEEKDISKTPEKSKKLRLWLIVGGAVVVLAAVAVTLLLTLGDTGSGGSSSGGSGGSSSGGSGGKAGERTRASSGSKAVLKDVSTPKAFVESVLRMSDLLSDEEFARFYISVFTLVKKGADPRYFSGMAVHEIIEWAYEFIDVETKLDYARNVAAREKKDMRTLLCGNLRGMLKSPPKTWGKVGGNEDNEPVMVIRRFFLHTKNSEYDKCFDQVLPTTRDAFKADGGQLGYYMKYDGICLAPLCDIRGNRASVRCWTVTYRPGHAPEFILGDGYTLLTVKMNGNWYFVPDLHNGLARNAWSYEKTGGMNLGGFIMFHPIKRKYELQGSENCELRMGKVVFPHVAAYTKNNNGKMPGKDELRKIFGKAIPKCADECVTDNIPLSTNRGNDKKTPILLCRKHGTILYSDGTVGMAFGGEYPSDRSY